MVGSAALVGSSNFTRPGLTQNVELNVRFQGPEVAELQEWYEKHWDEATPVNDELLRGAGAQRPRVHPVRGLRQGAPGAHGRTSTPPTRAGRSPSRRSTRCSRRTSRRRSTADRDVAAMERRLPHRRRRSRQDLRRPDADRVLRGAPPQERAHHGDEDRSGRRLEPGAQAEAARALRRVLERLVSWRTPTSRTRRAPTRSSSSPSARTSSSSTRLTTSETTASKPTEENPWGSRWWRMHEICQGKTVFLLTATPINNTLFDLVHQAELFTGVDGDDYFAASASTASASTSSSWRSRSRLAVPDHAAIAAADGEGQAVPVDHPPEQPQVRGREREAGRRHEVVFPETQVPRVVAVRLRRALLAAVQRAADSLQTATPLFVLPMYYPLAFSTNEDIDTTAENRQKQVVALIRTIFLKRFESSVAAFAGSCLDLSAKMLAGSTSTRRSIPTRRADSPTWRAANEPTLQGDPRPIPRDAWKRSGTRRISPRRSSTSSSTTSSAATTSSRR